MIKLSWAKMIEPQSEGGVGLDALWADDLHHQLHRALTGESEGYYADYSGSMSDCMAT